MSAKTVKLISPERVKQILKCYGANPQSWPADEKLAALTLIQHSAELRELQQQTVQFDKLLLSADTALNIEETVDRDLLDRIVNSLPEQEKKPHPDFVNRLPAERKSFLDFSRSLGAIAASLAVVAISLSIVSISPTNIKPVSSVASAQSVLDEWMWEQVVGEQQSEELDEPLSMMALLELEEL